MTTILIIDDEDDIRLAVKTLLESEGYTVKEATGGKEGLKVLKQNKIDLILLDFFMPDMNGRQVIEAIRKNKTLQQKIILLTVATFGKQGEKKLEELQVLHYIQKPFDNKKLLETIKKAVS
jgi:two-component system, OmpR family, aerobic respiration control protein ArcA